ncbi:nuclear receptor coactivator 7 [Austrofundulus limnaeus]|uniref:Nuclear receptor coactivator 7 n=1 Tax=Austrofundulus limnaeus TaxID=52670 RepID=A0A2I4ATI7_AUSLI|nr:PREDICTED: nuclear receptor coactivator 7-like [Austrofundulus limnaeus]
MGAAYSAGQVDHLYNFFVECSPDVYIKKKKKHCKSCLSKKKDPNSYIKDEDMTAEKGRRTSKNWEIISAKEKSYLSRCGSVESEPEENEYEDEEDFPVLSDESQLLNDYQLQKLAAHMPARTQGYQWNLVYSTAVHGSSLKTLYRNMADLQSPVLLVIKDMHNKVFGAFSSDPFRVSKYCYGTGETFLFSFNPDFQQYTWSGENSYFVSGNWESLQIGGGGGGFALWLDADLYHGASFSCPTFHNAPLSTHEDFIVQDIEVWTVLN